jgi:hypothetical protein
MSKVMVNIRATGPAPTLADLRCKYDLSEDEVDETFGVVEVDPSEHVYTVLVEESAAAKITGNEEWAVEGPFSNPRIEPFGPPESD